MGDVTTFESSFESNGNGRARPLEVIPAGRERRQWTPEAKARIIAASMAPRANVADIARRNDILPQQPYALRRGARERSAERPVWKGVVSTCRSRGGPEH